MTSICIHVPFRPLAQKRHRHTHAGRTYDPCSQQKADFLRLCMQDSAPPQRPPTCPIRCTLRFKFARPKSHCTSKGALRKGVPTLHVYKPDADNLAKFVLDALNGRYYTDDSQIYFLCIEKRYGDEDSVKVELMYG